MQAVFRTNPALLPDLTLSDGNLDEELRPHRLREIATEAMVRSSAEECLNRALRTKSRQSDLADKYETGEAVEFYRKPSTKDVSGWHGPAMIIYVKDGQVFIQWQGSVLICQRQDVRRAILNRCV